MGEVTIIGAGGVGTAAAADLTLAGHEVLLYEMPQFSQYIDPIIKSGGIRLAEGEKEEFAEISKATTTFISQIIGTDYFKEGRNLERLGISGLNPDQLQKLLNEG